MTVNASDVLLTLAEIAVAFAGFSSVVAIFQRGSPAKEGAFDLFRFWVMLEFSLASLFFCLLPFPLHFSGLSSPAVWSSSGSMLILFVLGHIALSARLIRRREPAVLSSLTTGLTIVANVAFAAIIVSQALNITGIFGRTFAPYLVGVFLLLVGAGVNFVRLVWVGNPPLYR